MALMDQWGVGRAGVNDGLVILFDLNQNDPCHGQIQLYAGPGYRETWLSNEDRQRVFENDMLPHLHECDMDGALLAAMDKVAGVILAGAQRRPRPGAGAAHPAAHHRLGPLALVPRSAATPSTSTIPRSTYRPRRRVSRRPPAPSSVTERRHPTGPHRRQPGPRRARPDRLPAPSEGFLASKPNIGVCTSRPRPRTTSSSSGWSAPAPGRWTPRRPSSAGGSRDLGGATATSSPTTSSSWARTCARSTRSWSGTSWTRAGSASRRASSTGRWVLRGSASWCSSASSRRFPGFNLPSTASAARDRAGRGRRSR